MSGQNPMICYAGEEPAEFRKGDVVFDADVRSSGPQYNEHVAFVWKDHQADSTSNVTGLYHIGLPESENRAGAQMGLLPSSGYPWNMAARPFASARDAEHCVNQLVRSTLRSRMKWQKLPQLHPLPLPPDVQTSCLGLVINGLRWSRMEPVMEKYGFEFTCPARNKPRNWPTIGHLARALTGKVTPLPFVPKDAAEAQYYAIAATTLREHKSAPNAAHGAA